METMTYEEVRMFNFLEDLLWEQSEPLTPEDAYAAGVIAISPPFLYVSLRRLEDEKLMGYLPISVGMVELNEFARQRYYPPLEWTA